MYFKQKLKSITISFTFSLVLSVFFITDYFLVSTTFDESVASVQMFQAYYQLQPCYISAIRLTREQLMKNETKFWIFGNFTNIA